MPVAAHPASVLSALVRDARYSIRLLRREPGYALVGILTIALGIGATTTLFSVVYGVLLKPLPWADPGRLVRVSETRNGRTGRVPLTLSNASYLAWSDKPSTIEALAGWTISTRTLSRAGDAVRLPIASITPSMFTVLRAKPFIGAAFTDTDATTTPTPIVLGYGLWQQRFGGSLDAIGRSIQLDGQPYAIAGVMSRDFAFPNREARAWVPYVMFPVITANPPLLRFGIVSAMARLRPGMTVPQAAAEATSRARGGADGGADGGSAAVALFGAIGPVDIQVVPALDLLTTQIRPALVILLVAVGLLLAAATANVASLQLARAVKRRQEIAIRSALGASGGQLTRQLLTESSMIGVFGGAAGIAVAVALHRALPSILPADFPRLDEVTIDWRVLVFATAVSVTTGLLSGLMPALHARRVNLFESLAETPGAPAGGGYRSATARARSLTMAGQITIACVLLVGAALLVRSFVQLTKADRGYDPTSLLTAELPLPNGYPPARRDALIEGVLSRLREVPGVQDAAVTSGLPLTTGTGGNVAVTLPGRSGDSAVFQAAVRTVSPGYFPGFRIRVVAGRALSDADIKSSPAVAVVNRAFARQYVGDGAVGAKLAIRFFGDFGNPEVVGVIDDMYQRDVTEPPAPEILVSFRQTADPRFAPRFVVRTTGDPLTLVPTLRTLVSQQDPSLALDSIMTMEDRLTTSLARPRLYAVLLAIFAAFTLAIAGVGLFGALSYSVSQRSREIGVRTALGAQPHHIVRLVLGQAFKITLAGLAVGLVTSFVLVRYVSTLLYGVTTHDPISFVGVTLVLMMVAAVACIIPARRAARIDPAVILRSG